MDATLPASYRRWRHSSLGAITERIEQDLIFELAGPLATRRVLDVGSGDGTYAIAAARTGADVTAVDASSQMLARAGRATADAGVDVELVQADAGSLPFRDDTFDVVLAVTLLCLVDDAQLAVRQMARVLKPGGRLVLGELAPYSSWAALRRVRGWLGSSTWRRARFRSAREVAALVASAGLVVGRTQGAIYYPPLSLAARVLGRFDAVPRRLTTIGAAFVAVAATKPGPRARGGSSATSWTGPR